MEEEKEKHDLPPLPKKIKSDFLSNIIVFLIVNISLFRCFDFSYTFLFSSAIFSLLLLTSFHFSYKKTQKINQSIDFLQEIKNIIDTPKYEQIDNSIIIRNIFPSEYLLLKIKEIAQEKGKK